MDVGGLEPPTPCLQIKSQIAISLIRFGSAYFMKHDFLAYSALAGPQLDPSLLALHPSFGDFVLPRLRSEVRTGRIAIDRTATGTSRPYAGSPRRELIYG